MTASFRGHVDIVRMLTEAKAPVNTQDKVYAAPTTRKCTMQDIVDVYMHAHHLHNTIVRTKRHEEQTSKICTQHSITVHTAGKICPAMCTLGNCFELLVTAFEDQGESH